LLSRNEGLKNRKIAETLGLSVKTVENQMTIALAKLRNEILPYIKHEIMLIFGLVGALLVT
jgi:RNA polymerase sigma-70 factor (ECF subfamily)